MGHPIWVRLLVAGVYVVEEIEAELEERTFELFWQRLVGRGSGDSGPGGAVEGDVTGGAFELHFLYAAVGKNFETDEDAALLIERRTGGLGDDGIPGALGVINDALQVGVEVNA